MTKTAHTTATATVNLTFTAADAAKPYGVERFNKSVRKARKVGKVHVTVVGVSPALVIGATSVTRKDV